MANQPLPSRPWLILGSMTPVAPPPAPSPAPAAASPAPEAQPQAQAQAQPPAPRPIFRPTFGQAFRPTTQQQPPQPQPQAQAQAQPPAPRPIFRPTFGQAFRPTTQQQPPQPPTAATAAPPFRVGHVSSAPSEKIKPPSPPPSALTLPPAHVKSTSEPIEQKILLIEKPNPLFKPSNGVLQRNVDDTAKPSIFPNYEKREQTMDMGFKDHKGKHKKANSEDARMEVITIAGDNKGAIMELSPSSKKHEPEGNSNKLTKTNPKTWWGSKLGSDASGDEEKLKRMVKTQNKMGIPSLPMNAFINRNVQAVNNSILVNTSCTNHDPGVRIFFSRGGGRGLHLKDCGDGQNN